MCALEAALYRLFVCRLHSKLNVRPNRRTTLGALGKSPGNGSDFDFPYYCRPADLAGSRCFVRHRARRQFARLKILQHALLFLVLLGRLFLSSYWETAYSEK